MENKNYTATILVAQTPSTAFNAIKNFRAWWGEQIEGETGKINEVFSYHYKDIHLCKMKLIELVADKKLVYQVVENKFNFTKDKSEWTNTKLIFEISTEGKETKIKFTHEGLVPENECYEVCHDSWNNYINKSLYNLITTGKGNPNGKDKPQTENEEKLAENQNSKMTEPNFTTTILVNQSPKEVFNAINNVSGWWQGEIEGSTNKLNDEFDYRMKDIHFSKQRVVELIPNQKVVWLVTESNLSFTKTKSEWTGTKIIFEISEINNKTQVRFTHLGLVPQFECYGGCSIGWNKLIQESLYSLITTGKGKDVF